MRFFKTLFERPEGGFARTRVLATVGWTLTVFALVVIGAFVSATKIAAACCGGLCGSCTITVYIYSFTTDKTGYTYGDQAILNWNSSGDYCILNGGNWNSMQTSAAGTLGVGLLNPGTYNISLQCVDTGGATTGTSPAAWVGFTVCSTGYTWNGSSCQPPAAPTNDVTVACGGYNELGCPGGIYNNSGQITKPSSGSRTLSVQSSHYQQSGDTLIAAAIVQLTNGWSAGAVNPDSYPYSPGSYSNAQVVRNDVGIANNSYTFTVTPTTPAGTYYFYPTTATNFYAWNNYLPSSASWSRVASITVLEGAAQLPTVTISSSGSPGEPSTAGTYTITRSSTSGTLNIGFVMSGTAVRCGTSSYAGCSTSTTDYYLSGCGISGGSGTALSLGSGVASCQVTLTLVDTLGSESTETAIMTLSSGSGYTLGSPSASTLNITDNDSSGTDICTDISGTQSSPPSGCNTPSPSPGACIPSGGSYNSGTGTCSSSGSFSFDLSSAGASITKGTSGSVAIQARRTGGSATSITSFFDTGAPSGVTFGSYSPTSCTPSTSWSTCTTLPVTVSSFATPGTYPITFYAFDQSGAVGDYANFDLVVQDSTQSFSYSLSASDVAIAQGSTAYEIVSATLQSGSAQAVTDFFWGQAPPGVTLGAFSPSSCIPTDVDCVIAPITVSPSAETGVHQLVVYGSGGSVYTYFYLTVTGQGGAQGLVVSITKDSNEGDAGELGTGQDTGTFILARANDPNGNEAALWVDYQLDGSATLDTDYTLGGTCDNISDVGATIPVNEASCTIIVDPIEDALEEGTETITITPIPRVSQN